MRVRLRSVATIEPYPGNPRDNDRAVDSVARSIERFGFRQPIVVDSAGVIIVGHTRYRAALQLGMERVPVHVASDLTDEQARAYRLADNRTGEEARWAEDLLAAELRLLEEMGVDLVETGFTETELDRLLQADLRPPDEPPPPPAEPKSVVGDVYQLGPHRLVCGSSADPAVVEALLADSPRAEVLWTDPPYGVDYVGKTARRLRIRNDAEAGTYGLLCDAFAAVDPWLAPSARFYVAAPPGPQGTVFRLALDEVGWRFHQALVWVKNSMVLGHSDYHYRHEDVLAGFAGEGTADEPPADPDLDDSGRAHTDVLYGFVPGAGRPGRGRHDGTRWMGDHRQTTVLEFDKPTANDVHPTMKPPGLIRRCLVNSSVAGDVVVDLFGGSGSTLVACHDLGRVAHLVELDPAYCDVIRTRYADLVGDPDLMP